MSKSGLLSFIIVVGFSGATSRAQDSIETVFVGGTVSVEELRNPLTGKSLKDILDAQRDLRSGHQDRAMEHLRQSLADPLARPYAVSILGGEHLKTGKLAAAVGELEEAVALLPGHGEVRSNLAYARALSGDLEAALGEARKALQLNPMSNRTRFILGDILLCRPESREQGIAYLRQIAADFPPAARELARYFEWKGQAEAAMLEQAAREEQANRGPSPAGALGFQSGRP